MTTKDFLPVLEAFVAGKEIECLDSLSKDFTWTPVLNQYFTDWNLLRYSFRIKHQPRTFFVRWCSADYGHNTSSRSKVPPAELCAHCEIITTLEQL